MVCNRLKPAGPPDPFRRLEAWLAADPRRSARIERTAGCGWQVVLTQDASRVALAYGKSAADPGAVRTLGETVAAAMWKVAGTG